MQNVDRHDPHNGQQKNDEQSQATANTEIVLKISTLPPRAPITVQSGSGRRGGLVFAVDHGPLGRHVLRQLYVVQVLLLYLGFGLHVVGETEVEGVAGEEVVHINLHLAILPTAKALGQTVRGEPFNHPVLPVRLNLQVISFVLASYHHAIIILHVRGPIIYNG